MKAIKSVLNKWLDNHVNNLFQTFCALHPAFLVSLFFFSLLFSFPAHMAFLQRYSFVLWFSLAAHNAATQNTLPAVESLSHRNRVHLEAVREHGELWCSWTREWLLCSHMRGRTNQGSVQTHWILHTALLPFLLACIFSPVSSSVL